MAIFDGYGEGSLHRNFVLKDCCVLVRCELSLEVRFPSEAERLVTELRHSAVETQLVIVNAREVLAIQLPSVDKLSEYESLVSTSVD